MILVHVSFSKTIVHLVFIVALNTIASYYVLGMVSHKIKPNMA